MQKIEKSKGQTQSERFLANLCDKTFLKLWSFANPFKADSKELCDLLAVFENHIFIFFDRESKKFDNPNNNTLVSWMRWKKEAIDKQIKTANGAENYIKQSSKIYLDNKCNIPFPLNICVPNAIIHKIIVAHGAVLACKNFHPDNISGSLAIAYGSPPDKSSIPFMVNLDKNNPVHILDSWNLEIILNELDTFYDFTAYLEAKEASIKKLGFLAYCGEEDLLAHYFSNFDESNNKHYIGTEEKEIDAIFIPEGEWKSFSQSNPYNNKKLADKNSYLWDELIQRTCQNVLDKTIKGNVDIFNGQSAIREMAKEPRFFRRALSDKMIQTIQNFPDNLGKIARHLTFMPSFYKEKGYVFLQLKHDDVLDYENDYRPKRQTMLKIACGVTKNMFPHLKKIIGIAIDAPKFSTKNSEDFMLLQCENWSDQDRIYYEEWNNQLNFFKTPSTKKYITNISEFPAPQTGNNSRKVGRNEKCPCGSGLKFKKCCGK